MIRDAERGDIPQLSGLIADFYAEAPYEAPLIDPEQTAFILGEFIRNIGDRVFLKVIDKDDFIVGAMLGERLPDLWSRAEKTIEHFLYVRGPFRNSLSAGRLVVEFGKWSQLRPSVVRVEASMGLDDAHAGKVFQKLGWGHRGTLYGLEAY